MDFVFNRAGRINWIFSLPFPPASPERLAMAGSEKEKNPEDLVNPV
jgi:hypothetical protein